MKNIIKMAQAEARKGFPMDDLYTAELHNIMVQYQTLMDLNAYAGFDYAYEMAFNYVESSDNVGATPWILIMRRAINVDEKVKELRKKLAVLLFKHGEYRLSAALALFDEAIAAENDRRAKFELVISERD